MIGFIIVNIACLILFLGMIGWAIRSVFGDKSSKKFQASIKGILRESWGIIHALLILIFTMIQSILRGIASVLLFLAGRKKKDKMKLYSARFASNSEIKKVLRRKHQGVCIDGRRQLSQEASCMHTSILAASGMGKSSSVLVPTLLKLRGKTSAIVHDPSGELARDCEHHLRKQGFEVYHLNVTDPDHSIRFSPLHGMKTEADAQEYAELIVDIAYQGKSQGDPFWSSSAVNLITSFLCMLLPEKDHGYCNMENLRHLLTSFRQDPATLSVLASRNLSDRMFGEYMATLNDKPETLKNICLTVMSILRIFMNENVARVCSGHTVDMRTFRDQPSVLFIQVPEHRIARYNPFLALVFAEIVTSSIIVPKPVDVKAKDWCSLHLLLDEFAQLYWPNFAGLAATVRKYKCALTILYQSPSQLNQTYTEAGAKTILSCMFNKLYMSGQGLAALQEVEALLGKKVVTKSHDESDRETPRSLMTVGELRLIPRGQAVFLQTNGLPMKLKLVPYKHNWWLRRKIRPSQPPIYEADASEMNLIPLEAPTTEPPVEDLPDPIFPSH